ncbi:hypothetical protein F4604DRAFT_1930676 [Suillus subluteus]|nr:hypothetical protein F4604DRAFT_1930676 [Suillus subluteus]
MSNDLHVLVRDGQVYTSLTTHSLPDVLPREPPWDPREDYNYSPDDSTTPLTHYLLGVRNSFSLLTEVDPQGKHILHRDFRAKWADLEQKMLWCMEHLGAGLFILWGTKLPCAPTTYGYQRWHTDANLAKKIAIRSRDAFLCSNRTWMAILMGDPQHPIPAEWVLELSRSFVGDLTTNVRRTGALISSIHCPWQVQLPMFEKFSLPIWVRFPQNTATVDSSLRHYIPSPAAVTHATEAVQWEQMPDTWGQPDDSVWGQQDDSTWGQPVNNGQSALGWDGSVVGWGQNSRAQPVVMHGM